LRLKPMTSPMSRLLIAMPAFVAPLDIVGVVHRDLHRCCEGANQKCCSFKGTKKL
jgi:hypothetical protein